jgi:hypothetical protein
VAVVEAQLGVVRVARWVLREERHLHLSRPY